MTRPRLVGGMVGLLVIAASCGGKIGTPSDGGRDADLADSSLDGAGWTSCTTPSGYELCGGAANCYPNCQLCDPVIARPDASVGICVGNDVPFPVHEDNCSICDDGTICIVGSRPEGGTEQGIGGTCVEWEVAELLWRDGFGESLMYADSSTGFDGSPLPAPSDCPSVPGLTLCGGDCGDTCPHDVYHYCFGRSPKHPYSLCATVQPSVNVPSCSRYNPPGDGKHGCLIFHVGPADQAQADLNGAWIDLPTCQAAAAGYPGGADCVTQ
jgi:hypothetical protein